jgi:hypothetical protein
MLMILDRDARTDTKKSFLFKIIFTSSDLFLIIILLYQRQYDPCIVYRIGIILI